MKSSVTKTERSGVFASSVAMDHEFARKLFAAEGIPVVPHAVLREGESLTESDRRRLGLRYVGCRLNRHGNGHVRPLPDTSPQPTNRYSQ